MYQSYRRLAFALKDVRDPEAGLLDIALNYGFSSHEAFTRAFREAYGVRLPMDYAGDIPQQMRLMDVPEGMYLVFEHGPFDFETENSDYELDTTPGRVFYFYHDCKRFWKYVRPVRKIN